MLRHESDLQHDCRVLFLYLGEWSMRSSRAMGSFVSFIFSTKILCGVNQILTVIAVIQIQNLRQAFMSKSRDLMSRNRVWNKIIYI
jgi:hypothetical protein